MLCVVAFVVCFYLMFLLRATFRRLTVVLSAGQQLDGLLAICIKILALYFVIFYDFAFIYLNQTVEKTKQKRDDFMISCT